MDFSSILAAFWRVLGRVLGGFGRLGKVKKSSKIGSRSDFDKKLDF